MSDEGQREAEYRKARSEWLKQIEDASLQAVQPLPTYQCGSPGAISSLQQQDDTYLRLRVSDTAKVVAHYTSPLVAPYTPDETALRLRVSTLEEGLRVASQELSDANAIIASWRTAWRLRDEAEAVRSDDGVALTSMQHPETLPVSDDADVSPDALVVMSDPPQSDAPDAPPKRGAIDEVVDALDKRLVGRTDRGRLRGALDKADAPLTGRDASDEALKRISGLGVLQGERR